MKLKFFIPSELEKNLKATIQKSGKMGFTLDAAKKLALSVDKSAGIAIDEDNKEDKSLYLVIYKDSNGGQFKISKAGDYFYINTKILFDNIKIFDYAKENVIFDITEENIDGEKVFKLKQKEKDKKEITKESTNI